MKVQAQSAEDTTIVIQGTGGTWCNDDFQNRSAGLDGEWLPGTYQIWVGTHRPKSQPLKRYGSLKSDKGEFQVLQPG